MRLGLALPHYDTSYAGKPASWAQVAEVAAVAEKAGFDSLWVSDHLFLDWGKYGGPDLYQGALECWSTLSALAAVTDRVRLGSLTLCNDFRNPGLLAKMIASLDRLSGGRVEVGLGAGWYEPEYAAAGIPFDRPAVRIRRLGETLEIVKRLLEGEELDYDGEHYQMKGAICRPGPLGERPALWVGGKGDLLLSIVAEHGDGWNWSWLGSLDAYAVRSAAADKACESVGRDPASLRRSLGAYVLVGRDDADVRRRFERLIERTPDGVLQAANAQPGVSWEAFRSERVAGTADEVIDRLGALEELGVEEVIVSLGALPFQVADEEDIAIVGELVAPALRG